MSCFLYMFCIRWAAFSLPWSEFSMPEAAFCMPEMQSFHTICHILHTMSCILYTISSILHLAWAGFHCVHRLLIHCLNCGNGHFPELDSGAHVSYIRGVLHVTGTEPHAWQVLELLHDGEAQGWAAGRLSRLCLGLLEWPGFQVSDGRCRLGLGLVRSCIFMSRQLHWVT